MEGTQPNIKSNAATRKRRSSILKSQRPPRTPFSEIELSVATPTDTVKSRRVSFSRLTGVAEFVTNQATTTWKSFYEEHNKSLESSGQEPPVNVPRPVGHISKRIFDEQFQDVESEIDFVDTNPHRGRHREPSLNIDISDQLAALESTENSKLLPDPKQNFELSALTDHQSKVFSDDLPNPTMAEFSDRIDVNFSVVDPLLRTTPIDDLDEIQKHLEQAQPSNFICQGPSRERREVSQYIEVDLNMTHATVQNDEYDMSITDTINSPKVNVSKNHSLTQPPVKKDTTNCDWEADKENIVVNPYVTPRETDNFAINDEPNKVLVFDGKRLTVQSEKAELPPDVSRNPQNKKNTMAPQRKTIVLNLDDDLPNFVDDINVSTVNGSSRKEISIAELKKTIIYDEEDLSITQAVTNKVSSDLVTQVYSSDLGNISMTQALPGNILTNKKRQTIIYADDTGNISMTQAISANILIDKINTKEDLNIPNTTVFDKNDISLTQALPNKIKESQREEDKESDQVTKSNDNFCDISMTQALPANILTNKKRSTIVFDNNTADISMTQALPPNILIPNSETDAEVNKPNELSTEQITTVDNLSITEALPGNILSTKRKTMYEEDLGDISMTQALPPRILLDEINNEHKQKFKENEPSEFVLTGQNAENDMLPELSKTEVYDADDKGDISMTQVLPSNILVHKKRQTIIYNNDTADISVEQALPPNILVDSAVIPNVAIGPTVKPDDLLLSLTVPDKELLQDKSKSADEYKPGIKKRCTIVFEDSNADISVTNAIPQNNLEANVATDLNNSSIRDAVEFHNISSKCKLLETAVVFSKDLGSSTPSRPIPNKFIQEVYLVHEQKCDNFQPQTVDSTTTESCATSAKPSDLTLDSVNPKTVELLNEKSIIDNLLDMDSSCGQLIVAKNSRNSSAVSSNTNAECDVESGRTQSQITDFSSVEAYPILPLEFRESEDDKKVELERKDEFQFNVSKSIEAITEQNDDLSIDVSQDNDNIVSDLKMENKQDSIKTADVSNVLPHYSNKTIEKHDKTNDISVKCRMSLGNVNEYVQPRRLSFASNRQSIVLSREDMLNNISMAQALLQKSTYNDTDESVNLEESIDQSTQSDPKNNHVVKMLTFDDDGDDQVMEDNNDSECGQNLKSPLKKLTFLEDSQANDKSKVIPSYLKDVSNCMKELMLDLVKPMADVRQTALKEVHGEVASSSQQIQANLVASSQIDSDSSASSMHEIRSEHERISSKSKGNVTFEDVVSDVIVTPKSKGNDSSPRQNPLLLTDPSQRVLQFDHENPLNNILIMPKIISEPHPYPNKSVDCITPSVSDEYDLKDAESNTDPQDKAERSQTNTYNFYQCAPKPHYPVQDELAFSGKESLSTCQVPESQSTTTTEWTSLTSSKGFPHVTELKDAKENTIIAMVNNETLLASQPSLGLIDDGIDYELSPTKKTIFSPLLKVDVTAMNRKKRSLSVTPAKQMQTTNNEQTLKPILKMPRLSNSPPSTKSKGTSVYSESESEYSSVKETLDKATIVTVAHCMTSSFKHGVITDDGKDIVKVTSNASGDKLDQTDNGSSETKHSVKQISAGNTWDVDEKPSATDTASCFNVITMIDQLPFIGTEELEWESWSGDTWGFRLERGRLRLSVRLAHRVGNSLRSLVRADTPVRSLQLSTPAQVPTEDVLSWLCSSYAAVDMFGAVEAGVCHAAQVPALLRRLAASARLAHRWARALHDIRARLALTIHPTEPMLLKVANVPLRCVWEVSICVEPARDPARLAVWPRASRVSVATLAGDTRITDREINDLIATVPDDWGHVPRAIWKIFKYLKVKKPVDQQLGMRPPILKQHIPV